MPSGGTVHIQLSNSDSNEALLVVTDDGPGMDEHTRSQLFNPYFTTRASKGGTGLGLSIVHGIVTELKGKIEVDSQLEVGTRLTVHIPLHGDDLPEIREKDSEDLTAEKKGLRIFVVDDDPFVGAMCAELLEFFGYEIELFDDASILLDRIREGTELPAGVVTDLAMPGMSGIDLTRALRASYPNLPIVCCTGFGSDALEREAEIAGVTSFARKPLDLENFGRIVKAALTGRSTSAST